jgi:hypothetical protein
MATHLPVIGGHVEGFGKTARTDAWWRGPGITFIVFSTFVVYTTWAALQGAYYHVGPYLSPFYSPVLFSNNPFDHPWFGSWPTWMPGFIPISPAVLILVFPGGFRFTCYYYRKAYYRSFSGSPPGCAVGPLASKRKYRGETALLLFQNLHRFFLYFALIFIVLLGKDAVESFFLPLPGGGHKFGVGVGSIILTINVVLIASYTFGCHSFRHLIGGRSDCMSCGKETVKFSLWKRATWFNIRHMEFAWASLIWVMVADLYVRLVAMGKIHDFNTWPVQ